MRPDRLTRFTSDEHDQGNAAVLGMALGVCVTVCMVTGGISHWMQHPPDWFTWPSRPVNFYRVSQGLHVATGIASIPLLLAKLWVIFPKLFEWPPVAGPAHLLERISLPPLIGGMLFQIVTGLANLGQWYFFPFFFTTVHYAMAWVTVGALVVHVGAKWTIARQQSRRALAPGRRSFLIGVFSMSGLATLFTVGQSFSPLGNIALLAPRKPGVGPQGLPVNKTAQSAGIEVDPATYRLVVEGPSGTRSLSLDDLRNLQLHDAELPIACVEGWSASGLWRGIRVRELIDLVGGPRDSMVKVESIERNGLYATSVLDRYHTADPLSLLALELNGEALHIDHGYPLRLIAPNRPGVMQTKWVNKVTVL